MGNGCDDVEFSAGTWVKICFSSVDLDKQLQAFLEPNKDFS